MIGVGQILEAIATFQTELSRILLECHTNFKWGESIGGIFSVSILISLTNLTRSFLKFSIIF